MFGSKLEYSVSKMAKVRKIWGFEHACKDLINDIKPRLSKVTCAPCKYSDQPWHLHSLLVFCCSGSKVLYNFQTSHICHYAFLVQVIKNKH